MSTLTNRIEAKENELQGLSETEEKSTAKEKKYMQQVDALTKKIELLKQDILKKTKEVESSKKDIKASQAVSSFSLRVSMQSIQRRAKPFKT